MGTDLEDPPAEIGSREHSLGGADRMAGRNRGSRSDSKARGHRGGAW